MLKELDLKNVVTVDGKEYMLSTVKLPYSGFGHLPYETMLFAVKKGKVYCKDLYCECYATEQEARERHESLLKQLQNGERIWENDL